MRYSRKVFYPKKLKIKYSADNLAGKPSKYSKFLSTSSSFLAWKPSNKMEIIFQGPKCGGQNHNF